MSKSETLIQFTNCRLVRNHQLIRDDLWIRNGCIVNPEPIFFDEKAFAHKKYDCKNAIIAAGYIDLQINGGYGVDFSFDTDTVEEGINKVAKGLIKNGVTSFCPTLVTSPPETYRKVIPRIPKATNGAGILGLHLEGPFINAQKKGAHPENCIRDLDEGMKTVIDVYGSLDNVKILTMAPEKDSSGETIRTLTDMGITVACGHSMGNLKDGENAVKNGASLITHLFNAMLPFHHRDPGLVGLLASNEIPVGTTVYFGLISDGVHTHPTAMRIAYRTHPEGLILVTDAISALGLEEGIHHIGQLKMEVRDSKAFIAGTNTLCGSIAPMDECVRIFKKSTGCSTVYAIEAATLHPAKCIKIENSKGTLGFETDADFILLDDDLNVLSTWINGECVYSNGAIPFERC
ncbi:putative N-acetylglucosamine-6-phosphate deacetylase [Lucilia cuprina]|uniref:N-acetylglucosamine-6-phosphate deacetylase n=1 Tax=Lucilia cuprina TaxID=7375 RepID=A0A0L0C510_LUCCU|nr:N-acetylglucosamine-6-phosphate deacetylase [Lucilia cuprina]KAI8122779.1 N-acetylglucosamine-6-phosphate deacetylase [Lucilia cuprina]KNC27337.1 putative N-acetylglucosamine-6-phosphate deacetylase [Lucilia cuprina]